MDRTERRRSAYRKILRALDEAIFCLERAPSEDPDHRDAEQQGTFRLGEAGGIAFSAHLPGADSRALFDQISDAVETGDLDAIRQIRSLVEARLRPGSEQGGRDGADAGAPAEGGRDWDAGYLQILGVLNETRRAREDGDAHRHWIMSGFLAGLLEWDERPGEHEPGELRNAVISATNEGWGENLWLEWEAIREEWLAGEAPEAPEDPELLFKWMGLRRAAADLVTGSLSSSRAGRAEEQSCFLRCERSTRHAQHFGRGLASRNRVPENDPRT